MLTDGIGSSEIGKGEKRETEELPEIPFSKNGRLKKNGVI